MEISYRTELPEKEQLYELYGHLGWNEFLSLNAQQLLQAMQNSYYSVYAYADHQLVATGRVISDGVINAYLCGLGVRSEYRHRGIATHIVNMLAGHCKENYLHIQFFCEGELVPFYEKLGFYKFAEGMALKEDG